MGDFITPSPVIQSGSAADTTSAIITAKGFWVLEGYVVAGAGVVSGTVVIEASPQRNFAGTWATLGSASINAAFQVFRIQTGSSNGANTAAPFIRARISSAIVGGVVDVYIVAVVEE